MKKLLPLCLLLCLLTGCAKPQAQLQATEALTSPAASEATVPTETESTAPTEPAEIQTAESTEPVDEDYYSLCTSYSKTEVEQFAREVREMILSKDWGALADRVRFPFTMGGVTYEDKEAFLNIPFDTLLNPDAIAALEAEDCADMFFKFSGIMLGNGEVWISEVLNEDFSSAGLWVIGLHILSAE